MAVSPSTALTTKLSHSDFRNPNPNFSSSSFSHQRRRTLRSSSSGSRNLMHSTPLPRTDSLQLHHRLLHLAASTVLIIGLGSARASAAVSAKIPDLPPSVRHMAQEEKVDENQDFDTPTSVPAASKFATDRIGDQVRGPSPVVHQWIEFCLQAERALPFKQEVLPGASPFALEDPLASGSQELTKGKPKLDTNLVARYPRQISSPSANFSSHFENLH